MEELLILYRKMTMAKHSGQKLRYLWYKRKYDKMNKKLSNTYFIKK